MSTRMKASAWLVKLVAGLTMLSGLVMLALPLLERLPERLERLELFAVELSLERLTASLRFLLGVALVYVSFQLFQRKLMAWRVALGTVAAIMVLELVGRHALWLGPVFALVVVILWASRDYFRARSESHDIRQGAFFFGLSLGVGLLYGTIGFYVMRRHDFGAEINITNAFIQSVYTTLLLGSPDLAPHTRYAERFLESLHILGIMGWLYGLYSLFRPLDYRWRLMPAELKAAEQLVRTHSRTSEDYFKLWPTDKSYFFARDRQAVIAFSVRRGVAIAAGDPVGEPRSVEAVVSEFSDYCLENGWTLCFVYTSDQQQPLYKKLGLNTLQIGEDAVVDLSAFAETTVHNKHFRNIRNRFTKKAYRVDYYSPPHSARLLSEIAVVSRAWASRPSRKEWAFFAGSFQPAYLQRTSLFVLRDESGQALAFANEITPSATGQASIDLMRYRPNAPSNSMDYLFMEIMLRFRDQGYRQFNLGLAPLSGIDEAPGRPEERLLKLIYRIDQPFLSLKGLRQFKLKFEPNWQKRYIVYRGTPARLPAIGLALAKLMRAKAS